MGKVYRIRTQDIGRFLRRVEHLLCYRCGVELIAEEWVFSKASRGDCSTNTEFNVSHRQLRNSHIPKVYHLECAKEVHLV